MRDEQGAHAGWTTYMLDELGICGSGLPDFYIYILRKQSKGKGINDSRKPKHELQCLHKDKESKP